MAKTHEKPQKLTKAEAGRLGGKATLARHGTEHFRTIGKAGFQALRKKFGFMGGSGRGAILWLQRQRKSRVETPTEQAQAQAMFHELWARASARRTSPRRRTRSSRRSWRRSAPHRCRQTEGSEMPRPRLSPEERKERRREAALKGIAARAAKPETDPVPTAARLVARAQAMGRECDLYYHAHLARTAPGPRNGAWRSGRPSIGSWTGSSAPTGTVQPVPHRRRKRR